MTSRALIVAVEHYENSTATSQQLPGTIAAANQLAQWLQHDLGVDRRHILYCSSDESPFRTHGTSTAQVKKAILDLVRQGYNDTEKLFVFLSGHGLMIPRLEQDLSILLTSDFIDSRISGDACIEVNELTKLLARCLGIGNHFYFVDACRTKDERLDPARLGINLDPATSGTADFFQLWSGRPYQSVPSNSSFVDALLRGLNGGCDLVADESVAGRFWVTFDNVSEAVAISLAGENREVLRSSHGGFRSQITSLERAGDATTIVTEGGKKIPPVELLKEFEEIIFLGETNGQLVNFVKEAFADRDRQRWKRLDVFSIEDLSSAFRNDRNTTELEAERNSCEDFFRTQGKDIAEKTSLYRYRYAGAYASLWQDASGKRRAHVSVPLPGEDIRVAVASDFVDFPNSRHPKVDRYFDLVERVVESEGCHCIFEHPEPIS